MGTAGDMWMFMIIPFCWKFILQDIPREYIAAVKEKGLGAKKGMGAVQNFPLWPPDFRVEGKSRERG